MIFSVRTVFSVQYGRLGNTTYICEMFDRIKVRARIHLKQVKNLLLSVKQIVKYQL